MNAELVAALVALLGLALCGLVCVRDRSPMNRLIALELASIAATVVTLLFALDINTGSFVDLAVVFGVVSLPSALVFLRFLERWI